MRAHTHTKRQTQSERLSKKAAAAAAWGMCATTNSRTKIQTSRIHTYRVAPSFKCAHASRFAFVCVYS